VKDRLPDDLDALGRALEQAARRDVRRRQLVARVRQATWVTLLAVPLALAVSADDISPSMMGAQEPVAEASAPPSWAFAVAHIPDEMPPAAPRRPCLDGLDCVLPVNNPVPFPAPEGKP
jgi:hypothetical protein